MTKRKEHADAYAQCLLDTGVAGYRATPGNRGVWMLRRDVGGGRSLLVERDAELELLGRLLDEARLTMMNALGRERGWPPLGREQHDAYRPRRVPCRSGRRSRWPRRSSPRTTCS